MGWVLIVGGMIASCTEAGPRGSGNARAEVRPVAAFSALEVSGVVGVELALGPEVRVELSGDDNLLPLVDTQIGGTVLTIRNREAVRAVAPLVARITAPRIAAVTASGASRVTLHGMHGEPLAITVHGAATVRGDGAIPELAVHASGAGTVDLDGLTAERARVTAAGSATVAVDVTRALDVRVSGAGKVSYRGSPPSVTQEVSGAGSLVKR